MKPAQIWTLLFTGSAFVSPFLTAIARDSVLSDTQQALVRALTVPASVPDEVGDVPVPAAPQASTASLQALPSGPNSVPVEPTQVESAAGEGLNWQPLYPQPASVPTAPRGTRGLVRSGDTLLSVAQRYGMTVSDLLRLNPGVETASLTPGIQLRVAPTAPMRAHMLLALKPMGSGALSWPDLPNLPQVPQSPLPAGDGGGDYIWPTQGVFSSGYGWRWGRMHKGIDLANSTGTPIVAAKEGRVTFAGWHEGGYGYLVEISHANGSITRYGHNSRLLVGQGQEVRQGEVISQMGSTGNSTGPHLHFEIIAPGMGAMNPLSYLPPQA